MADCGRLVYILCVLCVPYEVPDGWKSFLFPQMS